MALSDQEFKRLQQRLLQQKQQQDKKDKPLLEKATEFTGIKKAVEMAAPAAEVFAIGGSYLQGEQGKQFRENRLLGKPLGEASQVMEEKGIGAASKTIIGQGLEAGARMAPFVSGGLGKTLTGKGLVGNKLINFANSFVGRSAEVAFAKSIGEDLQNNTPYGKLFRDASVNALTAAAISYTLGKLGEKVINRFEKSSTKLIGRGLDTSYKKIQGDIEKGRSTINTKILEEGYRGTNEQIRKQAVANLNKYGNNINYIVNSTKGVIYKKDVIKVFDELVENNVTLEPSQLNLIIRQIDKIPEKMTIAQANQFKQQFAKLVPPNAWDVTASSQDTFRAQLFKTISSGFRKEIEKLAPTISNINEKWSIALDVLGLVSKQLAKSEVSGGLASKVGGGPFGAIVKGITSPFTATVTRTTRAQILNALAKAGRYDLVQEIAKFLVIKAESEK